MPRSLASKRLFYALILTTITICYSACSKTGPKPVVTNPPATISSISVNSGTYNTVVVITGTGFDDAPGNDKVFFNGKPATVSAATSTQLTVTVPLDAGTGNITLSVNNATPISGPVFTYNTAAISSIDVNSGFYNTTVTITGTGFDPTPANNKVLFNGKIANVLAATTTQLTVAVPLSAGTGNITVSVNNATPVSGPVFTYQTTLVVTTFARYYTGAGSFTSLSGPSGLATDAAGNVYVADTYNNSICKITAAGVVKTLAGGGAQGSADGKGSLATFYNPGGVAVDAAGNVYVADTGNGLIRKITPDGVVTTIDTGPSPYYYPTTGIAVDPSGNIYLADKASNTIRKVTAAGAVTTFAGHMGPTNYNDGTGTTASFTGPVGLATDGAGNVYVADSGDELIRKITPDGVVTTVAGRAGVIGWHNGAVASATFGNPTGVTVDAAGNLYVADNYSCLIRNINTTTGMVTTFAGGGLAGLINGPVTSSAFYEPTGVAVDAAGNVFVADKSNNVIRKISVQ